MVRPPEVLIVEDDHDLQEALQDLLEEFGIASASASDGGEAIAALDGLPSIRLVITDVRMPVVDGWQLLRRLQEVRPGVPAIVMTAHRPDGLEGVPVLRKPFDTHAMLAEVFRLLGADRTESHA